MKTPRESVRKRLRRAEALEKSSLHKAKPEQKLARVSSPDTAGIVDWGCFKDGTLRVLGFGLGPRRPTASHRIDDSRSSIAASLSGGPLHSPARDRMRVTNQAPDR